MLEVSSAAFGFEGLRLLGFEWLCSLKGEIETPV